MILQILTSSLVSQLLTLVECDFGQQCLVGPRIQEDQDFLFSDPVLMSLSLTEKGLAQVIYPLPDSCRKINK